MIYSKTSRSEKKSPISLEKGLRVFIGIAFLLSLVACASTPQSTGFPSTGTGDKSLEDKWGIRLEGIRLTAAGYMIDFRYRVIDPEKAAPLLSRQKIERHIIVEKSGAVLQVPSTEKLGALRSAVSTPDMVKRNRIYGALFANPGKHVKPGDKVTVVIGDFKAENIIVE